MSWAGRLATSRSIARCPSTALVFESVQSRPAISPLSHSTTKRSVASCVCRVSMVLGTTESLMPLHNAVASARLRSILGVGSYSWSSLSQGFAIPL